MDDHGIVSPPLLGNEWLLAVRTQANLLVTGHRTVVDRAIREVAPWLRHPIVRVTCTLPLTLPIEASTLILDDVDALTDAEQTALLKYLDDAQAAMQVISSTATPLYPRVQAGFFSDVLYYRLNMLYLPLVRFGHESHPIPPHPNRLPH